MTVKSLYDSIDTMRNERWLPASRSSEISVHNVMFQFEWDNQKAERNVQKHGISFDEAVTVFSDPMALTFLDTAHSEAEDRSRTYGISNTGRLLVVVHTERRNCLRIISARKATRYEQSIYSQG